MNLLYLRSLNVSWVVGRGAGGDVLQPGDTLPLGHTDRHLGRGNHTPAPVVGHTQSLVRIGGIFILVAHGLV